MERARFFSEGDLSEHAGQDLPLRLKGFILGPRRVAIVPPRFLSDPHVLTIWSAWKIECHGRKRVAEERGEWGLQNWKINTSAIYPFRPRKIVRDVAFRAAEISKRISSISYRKERSFIESLFGINGDERTNGILVLWPQSVSPPRHVSIVQARWECGRLRHKSYWKILIKIAPGCLKSSGIPVPSGMPDKKRNGK